MKFQNRNKWLYFTLYSLILALSLGVLWQANTRILSNPAYIPVDDFGHYWAAGKLTIEGKNPYDPGNVQNIRNLAAGFRTTYAVVPIAWTPPWSLILLIPYGVLSYPLSRILWLTTCIAIIMICSDILWQIYSSGRNKLGLIWVIALTFGPSISVLQKGQITPWILVGITGFLYYLYIRPNDWGAGASTIFISLKPQLYYLFWPVFILWGIKNRRWHLLISSASMMVLATLLPILINHGVLLQYVQAILFNTPKDWATPTLGGYLRLLFGIEHYWLQFTPLIIGFVWVFIYWAYHKDTWTWKENTPPLIYASILTVAYAWTYDQVIILVAIISVLSGILAKANQKTTVIFIAVLMIINLSDLLLHRNLDEFWFGWLAPLYLAWYMIGLRKTSSLFDKPLHR